MVRELGRGGMATVYLGAYEQHSRLDSARVMYERLVNTPSSSIWYDAGHVAHGYVRLGEMAELAGDHVRAVEYYDRLLTLPDEADEELQPLVDRAREALLRLTREEAGTR